MTLYVTGDLIPSDTGVVLEADGKVYPLRREGMQYGTIIGVAAEQLREGFRVYQRDGKYYEDDA